MPQITSITEQKANLKRRQKEKDRRFNIFLDGKYSFSVGEENLLKFKVMEYKILTQDEINSIKGEENQSKLLDRAVNFLSYRPRSEKEVKDYLIKTISKAEKLKWNEARESSLPDIVIEKLRKYGYINDVEFAKWWIESRTKAKPKGRKLIELELKGKGVDSNLIVKLLPNKSKTDINLALKVLEKKKTKLSKLQPREVQKKVFNYLAYRGFDIDTIKETFAIYSKKR